MYLTDQETTELKNFTQKFFKTKGIAYVSVKSKGCNISITLKSKCFNFSFLKDYFRELYLQAGFYVNVDPYNINVTGYSNNMLEFSFKLDRNSINIDDLIKYYNDNSNMVDTTNGNIMKKDMQIYRSANNIKEKEQ